MSIFGHGIRRAALIGALLAVAPAARAQPLVAAPAVAPAPDLVPARVLGARPPGNFFENVARGPDGALYITSYVSREILRYDVHGGTLSRFALLDVHPVGIAFDSDGVALVTAHRTSVFKVQHFRGLGNVIYTLDPSGRSTLLAAAPDAGFLNGILRLPSGRFLIADATAGVVWSVRRDGATPAVWRRDPFFTPTASDPLGANGLKLHDGRLYVSSSGQQLLLTATLAGDDQIGPLQVVQRNLPIDDFAFGRDGTLYSASHGDEVLRTRPDGRRTVIAGVAQGVKGSTALIFGVDPQDRTALYVIGDGGLFKGGPLLPARLTRLDVGESGDGGGR